jgi:L-lactate utilization protein LutB
MANNTPIEYLNLVDELEKLGMDDDVLSRLHEHRVYPKRETVQDTRNWFKGKRNIRAGNQRNYNRMTYIRDTYNKNRISPGDKVYLLKLADDAYRIIPPEYKP